ncbi:hypothetical protein A4X13_0g4770 [Tilletia indica]|uniref:Uncharacterized protein n=1 Tax=Tilletia indica TaxID=43049 RepID=A0A177TAT3_9BASI|nr:hypothetical protein A4X13_0g4770 [Tilletia indica]
MVSVTVDAYHLGAYLAQTQPLPSDAHQAHLEHLQRHLDLALKRVVPSCDPVVAPGNIVQAPSDHTTPQLPMASDNDPGPPNGEDATPPSPITAAYFDALHTAISAADSAIAADGMTPRINAPMDNPLNTPPPPLHKPSMSTTAAHQTLYQPSLPIQTAQGAQMMGTASYLPIPATTTSVLSAAPVLDFDAKQTNVPLKLVYVPTGARAVRTSLPTPAWTPPAATIRRANVGIPQTPTPREWPFPLPGTPTPLRPEPPRTPSTTRSIRSVGPFPSPTSPSERHVISRQNRHDPYPHRGSPAPPLSATSLNPFMPAHYPPHLVGTIERVDPSNRGEYFTGT